ncbi:MAG: AAA family ATPase [Desulfomonilia bacterium]
MKRIEIRGFKSVAKKTSLPVADGVTCIAGPNGCGKSNIIDAVRWALGEQSNRSLRAGSMSEVIFSGTQDVPPGSMAEVVMEFARDGGYFPKSLDGFDEASISRRLYRTGESIYSLNGVRCRLKDITDLFLDTGLDRHRYAIVEQGKVKDIIQSRPEDIRYLIEEAAEVGRFRFKRADAIKRLEATAGNLERVRDLLTEVSRQRDELKSQANKARRYQGLRSEINSLTKMLWASEIQKITEKKEKLDEMLQEVRQQEESFRKQHEEYARAMGGLDARLSVVRGNMDEIRRAMEEARSSGLLAEGEIEANTNRARDIASTIEMLQSRIGQMTRETGELRERGEQERGHLERLSLDIAQIEEEMDSRNLHLESVEKEFGAFEGEYNQKRAQLFDAIGHSRATQQRISSMEIRRHEAQANARKRRADLSELGSQRASLESKYEGIEAGVCPGEISGREPRREGEIAGRSDARAPVPDRGDRAHPGRTGEVPRTAPGKDIHAREDHSRRNHATAQRSLHEQRHKAGCGSPEGEERV